MSTDRPDVEAAVRRHGPWLLRWFERRLPPDLSADDLAQEVFLVLHRRREEIEKPASLAAFLLGVARKVRARALEKRAKRRRAETARPAPEAVTPPAGSEDPLDTALEALPAELRMAVWVYHTRRITYEEAASILGISRPTFQSRLRRALALLQAALEEAS